MQIEDDVQGFTYHTDVTSIAVYGGVQMGPQERALKSGVDIVVATPGRLMDHMRSNAVDFDKLDTLVLDEADRMMDMGFWPDVRRIVATLPDAPRARRCSSRRRCPTKSCSWRTRSSATRSTCRSARRRRPGADDHARRRERPGGARRPSGWRSSCGARTGRCWSSCGRSRAPSGWRASCVDRG